MPWLAMGSGAIGSTEAFGAFDLGSSPGSPASLPLNYEI